ncbi:hypothetical protein JD844_014127 [Phrynosoma platyrhinos]|uniref:Protein FAM189A2 n=1 Tax=Phrynosoma platyrhinos TaxID=52577 RepID=A0ABQ7SR98_PHRPL|nr:hypothetical protein JD844_014127 [Phrynosoma platyrhinos]
MHNAPTGPVVQRVRSQYHLHDCLRSGNRHVLHADGLLRRSANDFPVISLSTIPDASFVSLVSVAQFLPQRSHSAHPDCMTPHGTIVHQTLDFDEFIPPIPPPPYYPPEYTCTPVIEAQRGLHLDFPHSPFSTLYEVSINSPGMLYPTELPPPYEAVIGQTTGNQVSTMEQQVIESNMVERNPTTEFSSQALVDSTSQMASEVVDLPNSHTYSSGDLCSLEVQESFFSADLSSYTTTHKGATTRSCSSLDYSIPCGLRRTHSPHSLDDEVSSVRSPTCTDGAGSKEYGAHSCSQSEECSSENFCASERDSPGSVGKCKPISPPKLRKICCGAFSQSAVLPPLPVCSPHVAASACQDTGNHLLPTGKLRDSRKAEHSRKPKALQTLCKERPHSLVDLQAYKDTKILVAKFLEHSNCNLPPEVRHVVNSIRSVIKSDERHMEEAIFSANIIDQVITSSQQTVDTSRKRLQEDLHLQSCGALSSPVAFLRRAHVTHTFERGRPHSFIGVCRETIL